jgi:hypothetical protein
MENGVIRNFDRSQPLPPKPAEKTRLSMTLAESSRSGGHATSAAVWNYRKRVFWNHDFPSNSNLGRTALDEISEWGL